MASQCDQATPICLRCERNRRDCSYPQEEHEPVGASPSQDDAQAWSLTFSRILSSSPDGQGPEYGTPRAALLLHFGNAWQDIFDLPRLPVDIDPALDAYHFLHRIVLAISASHLRHRTRDPRSHRVAEAFQQAVALADFQTNLARPLGSLGPAGIDALLLASMLLNMLSFALPPDEDAEPANCEGGADVARSWVFSTREDRLSWLAVLMGLKPLLEATRPYRKDTILGPVFDASDEYSRALVAARPSLDAVPVAWLIVFGLSQGSVRICPWADEVGAIGVAKQEDEEMNTYLFKEPLRALVEIAAIEPTRQNIFRYVQLVGELEPEFRRLLYDRDERALWIFGYWLGLMCRFEGLWWCDRRVRRDYLAIRTWFVYLRPDERLGVEGKLWSELLRDLDAACLWPAKEELGV